MGRLKELDGIIRDLRDLADRANDAADRLGEMLVNAQADADEAALLRREENENLAYRH
jgi:hypothetical protein